MSDEIRSAAVLGAGVMGAAISAHLANAGIPNLLLDMKPKDLSDREAAAGATLDHPAVANRFAAMGLERAKKSKPASFFSRRGAALVQVGNFDDDMDKLAGVDWVIEAVVENLDIKRSLYERVGKHLGPNAVISSNTSGLSAAALSDCLPAELRSRFLVTHFFNPPRYLHLLELVRGPETDAKVYERLARFGEDRLGKGIVHAKDTPNFIANRIGTYGLVHAVRLMIEDGYTITEVDKLTGKAIGRPKSATFRTADLVGLDTLIHVAANMYENLPDDPERELFQPPEFVQQMAERKWLGEKTGQGFYKKERGADGKSQILRLDPSLMEYVEQGKVALPSLELAKNIEDLGDRLKTLVSAPDRGGNFLWKNLSATLCYAADRIPEISDDIVNVDRALRWGFGWEMGPFEVWDAIGVEASCKRLRDEGRTVPKLAEQVLAADGAFYCSGRRNDGSASVGTGNGAGNGSGTLYFDLSTTGYQPVPKSEKVLELSDLKSRGTLLDSPDATLIDLGDGVACLEFHTKMNTIGPGVIQMIEKSLDFVESDDAWKGLVIGNEGDNFCVGANLLLVLTELDDENYDDVDWMVRKFQDVNQKIRFSQRPVVVAPFGLTLGGGCEIVLAADKICASAETYIGLVELGAGIIPAGGGCKEHVKRIHERAPEGVGVDLFPYVRKAFETIGMAKVATSAVEAQELDHLRETDNVVMNRDHLIWEAKRAVLAMDAAGYEPGRPRRDIRVVGEPGLAALRAGIHNMHAGGYLTDYETILGDKLAWVLCGGEVAAGSRVDEQYLLDLEREAFMTLCEDGRTLQRMEHILKTGKPLRN